MRTKDAYYFPHDSNAKRDTKILMLRHQLGAEGYGLYWMLIEDLREQENYVLPTAIIPALAKEYDTTTTKLEAVINGYGLFIVEDDRFFFSQSLVKRMKAWDMQKEMNKVRAEKAAAARWRKALASDNEDNRKKREISQAMHKQCTSNAQAMQAQCTSNAGAMQSDAIRGEERREEENREENTKEEDIKREKIALCVSKISSYYSFNEMSDFLKFKEATQFITFLSNTNQLDYFIEQFAAYVSYKEKTGEKRHRFASFIGTPDEKYLDGGWNAANWSEELSRYNSKQSSNYVDDLKTKMAGI